MTAPDLRALIDEVEGAVGPSWELDCRLFMVIVSDDLKAWQEAIRGGPNKNLTSATHSIDFAIAFGKRILGGDICLLLAISDTMALANWHSKPIGTMDGIWYPQAEHKTAPLAIVLAALRAYAAKEEGRDGR